MAHDGSCIEILDVHVAALKGQGLPELQLRQDEEVDWAFFVDVFSDDAKQAGTVFHAEADYVSSICRTLRQRVVKNDVMNAFGPPAVAALEQARGALPVKSDPKMPGLGSQRTDC